MQSVDSVTERRAFPGNGGEKSGGGAPNAEDEDGLVDVIRDTRALGRHKIYGSRVTEEEAREPVKSTG